jgi:pSer/pThr/pTyr-binding forkhead associated (FHA) protein
MTRPAGVAEGSLTLPPTPFYDTLYLHRSRFVRRCSSGFSTHASEDCAMQVVLVMFRGDGERRSFSVARDMTVIGRREDCDLRIPVGDVSRKHCRLVKDGETLKVEDLGSSNGTYVNNQRVQEAWLGAGDVIQVGPVQFVVQIDGLPSDDDLASQAAVAADETAGGEVTLEEVGDEQAPALDEVTLEEVEELPAEAEPTEAAAAAPDEVTIDGSLEELEEAPPPPPLPPPGLDEVPLEEADLEEAPVEEAALEEAPLEEAVLEEAPAEEAPADLEEVVSLEEVGEEASSPAPTTAEAPADKTTATPPQPADWDFVVEEEQPDDGEDFHIDLDAPQEQQSHRQG